METGGGGVGKDILGSHLSESGGLGTALGLRQA